MSAMNGEKLKILAIHGYRQNADTFRQKTGSFRKIANKFADFTYITAPHKVVIPNDVENVDTAQEEDEQFGWFFNREDKSFRGIRTGGPAIGFEESVQLVEETFEKLGPFDGILGFSQGACLVSLLCHLQEEKLLKAKFKFAIMIAGFKSGSIPHSAYYNKTIAIPSLHVFGENDQIIPSQMSKDLSKCFLMPAIEMHPGGHFVPASSSQKETYQSFLRLHYLVKNCPDIEMNF
ncbi:esterase AGAP003155-like [Coccinella septempunctata]|uniref:esterase AGAP003155-like n=1 Tax=Coccinella septempunctata TaxID=41139 RepID=UPI001D078160|nr:esterase AGAP003155-like [Coccinella septempunctata]